MNIYYKLNENNEVVSCGMYEHIDFMASSHRLQVGLNKIKGLKVSTVFLGVDCGSSTKEPLVFETAIFYPNETKIKKRYTTWKEALEGHRYYCKQLLEGKEYEEELSSEGFLAVLKALTSENDS